MQVQKCAGTKICRCKINDLMKEETGASILFNPSWPQPLCFPDPLTLLTPIQLSFPLGLFLRPYLFRPLLSRNCQLPRTLFRFRNCVGCASVAGLQSHRRTLALGLTERLKFPSLDTPTCAFVLSSYIDCLRSDCYCMLRPAVF